MWAPSGAMPRQQRPPGVEREPAAARPRSGGPPRSKGPHRGAGARHGGTAGGERVLGCMGSPGGLREEGGLRMMTDCESRPSSVNPVQTSFPPKAQPAQPARQRQPASDLRAWHKATRASWWCSAAASKGQSLRPVSLQRGCRVYRFYRLQKGVGSRNPRHGPL